MKNIIRIELPTPFPEGSVNAFLAIGNTAITLIDTGNPDKESFKILKEEIHKHGYSFQDIDHILLTHLHIDHSGGVPFIQEEADLPVYIHEKAQPSINGGMQEFEREEAFYTDFVYKCGATLLEDFKRSYHEINWRNVTFLQDGDIVPLGGENFEVLYVPGHSQMDILFWNSNTGDAFIGDHLLKLFSVNAFVEPAPLGQRERIRPLLQYRNSLERIKKIPLKSIYPGHGEAYNDHVTLIEKRLAEQERRCIQIQNILHDEEKTIYEITKEMYPRLTGSSVFLGLSQIQGHLDLLESRNQIRIDRSGPALKYRNACKKLEKCR